MYFSQEIDAFRYFGQLNQLSIDSADFPPFHHQILRKEENLEGLINDETLEEVDSTFGFSPLHVAVLSKNVKAVVLIIRQAGKNASHFISKKDLKGWTPLHFNAILSCSEIDTLLKKVKGFLKIEQSIKNNLGATALVFRRCIESFTSSSSGTSTLSCQIEDKEHGIIECSHSRFKMLTGADFSHEILFSGSALLSLWNEFPKQPDQCEVLFYSNVKAHYHDYKESSLASVYLSEIHPAIGWGIRALKRIKKGSLIWEYSGKAISQFDFQSTPYHPEKVKYAVQFHSLVIDGALTRNLAAMTNCGFPNAYPHFDFFEDGLPHYVAIALEEIAVGEQVCIDYGCYPCKFEGYQELRKEALDHFLSNDLEELWSKLVELHQNKDKIEKLEEWIDFLNLQTKMKYLLQTSKVVYDALLKKNQSLSQMLRKIEENSASTVLDLSQGNDLVCHFKMIDLSIEKILLEEVRFQELFLNILEQYSVQAFDFLVVFLSDHLDYSFHQFEPIVNCACPLFPTLYQGINDYFTNSSKSESEKIKRIQATVMAMPVEIHLAIIEDLLHQLKEMGIPEEAHPNLKSALLELKK